jgi:peptidoglycan DL-endopeptidase CwlO
VAGVRTGTGTAVSGREQKGRAAFVAPESQQNVTTHRGKTTLTRARTAVTLATATAGTMALLPGMANADPAQTAQSVKARVDALQAQAEQATEAYDTANDQLASLQRKVDQIQSKITLEQTAMDGAQSSLGSMASAQYKSGGVDDVLQLMLATAPDPFLQQASNLSQVTSHEAETVQGAHDAARQLAQDKATAKDDLAALQKVRDTMAAQKKEIDDKEKAAQSLLDSLTQQERDQYTQIQAKADSGTSTNSTPPASVTAAPPASGRAAQAVAFAEAQVGKPYIPAGVGPYGFDCSGLTMAAWATAGVKMSHGSRDQYNEFPKVSLKDIQVGDLVIYYSSMHHVGIYVGGGTIVHAPQPGQKVSYAPIAMMPIAGIVRP